ncbi:MAG TPA: DUF4468 domain-containing protein [Allocoleopsis sp.]
MKYFLISIVFAPILCFAQKDSILPIIDGSVIYSSIIETDTSLTKEILFKRAKRFFVENYKSAKDVIQLEDENESEITGKGNFSVLWNMGALLGSEQVYIRHTINFKAKTGKYKYELKDFRIQYYSKGSTIGTSYTPGREVDGPIENLLKSKLKVHKRLINQIDEGAKQIISALKIFMAQTEKEW